MATIPTFDDPGISAAIFYAELALPILVCPASAERLNNVSNTVVKNITFIGFIMEHTWFFIVTFWAFSPFIFRHNPNSLQINLHY